MHSDETIANRLKDLADSADPAGIERVKSRLQEPQNSRGLSRRPMLATGLLGAAAAAAAIVALNATGVLGGTTHPASNTAAPQAAGVFQAPQSDIISVGPDKPCMGAVRAPLADIVTAAGTPVWMPSSPLANKSKLTSTWNCAGLPALMFGKIIMGFEPAGNVDPQTLFAQLAAARGKSAQVETLLGQPAFVAGPNDQGGSGEVQVVVGKTLVTVIGDGQTSAADLAAIVNSIDVDHPVR